MEWVQGWDRPQRASALSHQSLPLSKQTQARRRHKAPERLKDDLSSLLAAPALFNQWNRTGPGTVQQQALRAGTRLPPLFQNPPLAHPPPSASLSLWERGTKRGSQVKSRAKRGRSTRHAQLLAGSGGAGQAAAALQPRSGMLSGGSGDVKASAAPDAGNTVPGRAALPA